MFNKSVDEPDESDQAEFKRRVGDYVSGRLWRSFTDPMSCNLAVLQALRALEVDSGPVERRTPSADVHVAWISEVDVTDERGYPILGGAALGGRGGGLVPGAVSAPVLELHLIPVGSLTRHTLRYMADLAKSMAKALRDVGFVSESAQLEVGSAEDFAWVVRPPHVAERAVFGGVQHEQFRGLVADRSGAVGVYKALPADDMGTIVDRSRCRLILVSCSAWLSLIWVRASGCRSRRGW